MTLTPDQRVVVEQTIRDHCQIRGWHLWIVRCLSNHVHVVVSARDVEPAEVVRQFKAWYTRRLKAAATGKVRERWWTERASTRFLSHQDGLEGAILYVRDSQ
jgi:REP element-mobilizing transposase RayT